MIKQIPRHNAHLWSFSPLFQILRGLWITSRHLISNIVRPSCMMTQAWPEQISPLDESYRAEHRLMRKKDGTTRCTACMLCATICPANCIEIVASEGDRPENEKFASKYTIDSLRCVYCGLCVEACPCDAIRMDTRKLNLARSERTQFTRDLLRNNA